MPRRTGGLLVIVLAAFAAEAQASFVVFSSRPESTGGTFLHYDLQNPTFSADRLSLSVAGDYSVLADGSATTVTVTIDTKVLTPLIQGSFDVNTFIDGYFASSLSGTKARLVSYSATSDLFTIPGSNATVSVPGSPVALPTVLQDFPAGSLHLTGSASTLVSLAPGFVYQLYLEQFTTITFDNVTPGETLLIHLPNTTSLTPVPEPDTLSLGVIGGLSLALIVWRRNRKLAAL